MKRKKQIKKNFKLRILLCLGFAIIFAGIFFFETQIYSLVNNINKDTYETIISSDLVVHFIDVGQGDAIAIELPDDKVVLIDSGTGDSETTLVNYLRNNVMKNGSDVIDYFIITHPHEDHIGGSVGIFENFEIQSFYRPTVYSQDEIDAYENEYGEIYANSLTLYNTQIFQSMVNASIDEDCTTIFFSFLNLPVISTSEYSLTFLTPQKIAYDNVNNYSPMILLEYSDKTVLFTGDAETEIENEYLGLGIMDKVDVLKVGHHGSSSSSSEDFLNRIQPSYAIISVGIDNSYGHPTQSTITKLNNYVSELYRTDIDGTILLGITDLSVLNLCAMGTSIKLEVWQIYVGGCLVITILILTIDLTKLKRKIKKNK